MRVVTCNVNGIRSAAKKGFFDWMVKQRADVFCLQEIRAQTSQIEDSIYHPKGYHAYFVAAKRKGYSGVAIYCRQQPDKVIEHLGWAGADDEGRYLQVDFGNLSVVSIYLPSGSSGDARQKFKYAFMDHYIKVLRRQAKTGRKFIICGDINIVHKEIDIKNWKSNQKKSGCLPAERAWLDKVFDKIGFVDAFRVVNQKPNQYTWWSNRGRARENNVGWRIDYQIISPDLKNKVKLARVYKDKWFSDHAPLIMDYNIAG